MSHTDARAVVDAYLAAIAARDFERARALLADDGLLIETPVGRFDDADAFIDFFSTSSAIVDRVEVLQVFSDGDSCCHWLRYHTQVSEKVTTIVVQRAKVSAGRISYIESVFDAHRYHSMFGETGEPMT